MNAINAVIKFLSGKKTYICALMIGITAVLYSQGLIDNSTRDILMSVFGAGGFMALRAGIKKVGK